MRDYFCSANGCRYKADSPGKLQKHYADRHGMLLANSPVFYSTVKRKRPSKEADQLEKSGNLLKDVIDGQN